MRHKNRKWYGLAGIAVIAIGLFAYYDPDLSFAHPFDNDVNTSTYQSLGEYFDIEFQQLSFKFIFLSCRQYTQLASYY